MGVGTNEPREITGQEALELYGINPNEEVETYVTSTPVYFFPAEAWVLENENPYDYDELITILPMITRPGLQDGGTWFGDLEAGTEVVLHDASVDRAFCLVEGTVAQGWTTKGWVACSRLSYHQIQ